MKLFLRKTHGDIYRLEQSEFDFDGDWKGIANAVEEAARQVGVTCYRKGKGVSLVWELGAGRSLTLDKVSALYSRLNGAFAYRPDVELICDLATVKRFLDKKENEDMESKNGKLTMDVILYKDKHLRIIFKSIGQPLSPGTSWSWLTAAVECLKEEDWVKAVKALGAALSFKKYDVEMKDTLPTLSQYDQSIQNIKSELMKALKTDAVFECDASSGREYVAAHWKVEKEKREAAKKKKKKKVAKALKKAKKPERQHPKPQPVTQLQAVRAGPGRLVERIQDGLPMVNVNREIRALCGAIENRASFMRIAKLLVKVWPDDR